jgi:hypothetical protein
MKRVFKQKLQRSNRKTLKRMHGLATRLKRQGKKYKDYMKAKTKRATHKIKKYFITKS